MSARKETFFEKWAEREGIPVIRGYSVENLDQVPLERWERKGGLGAQIILEGGEGWKSAYICEIPPNTILKPQKHFFEERIYVIKGQGETTVWNEGGPQQTFAWQEYSLFSPPLNSWHQHRNVGDHPAKYVAVTNAPIVFNVFRDQELVYNCGHVFRGRYNAEEDYFDGIGKMGHDGLLKCGFIRDVRRLETEATTYGTGFKHLHFDLSNNSTAGHVSRLAVGAYKKAHRHLAGAHLIVIQGSGYTTMWQEGKEKEKIRIDWQKGSMFSPPENWLHQHFNTCKEEVMQVALRRGMLGVGKTYQARLDMKKGGDMIELEDEDPEIRKVFEEELCRKGIESRMP